MLWRKPNRLGKWQGNLFTIFLSTSSCYRSKCHKGEPSLFFSVWLHEFFPRLFEVLEISDDLAVDIPLFWDYFAVCVFEMVEKSSYSLDILARTVMKACDKAPKCVAKVLACCAKQSSPDDTSKLWVQSGLTWATLGLQDSTAVEDLLESEVCN